MEARFILPSSGGPPPLFPGGWPNPAPPALPGGALRGAMGLRGLPKSSPMVERGEGRCGKMREEGKTEQKKKLEIKSQTSYQASHYGVERQSIPHESYQGECERPGEIAHATCLAVVYNTHCPVVKAKIEDSRGYVGGGGGGRSGKEKRWLRTERDRAACVA